MEPLAVRVDHIPGVVAGADGEAGDASRPAQELERSGVGAAGRLQFPAVLGKGAGHARRLALFV